MLQEYTAGIGHWQRMEADIDAMRRAITKEFKQGGGQYVFGKALDFHDWCLILFSVIVLILALRIFT